MMVWKRAKSANQWKPSYWRPGSTLSTPTHQNRQVKKNQISHNNSPHLSNFINDEIRRTALQKYTPFPNKQTPSLSSTNRKGQGPLWISKLQDTVINFRQNIVVGFKALTFKIGYNISAPFLWALYCRQTCMFFHYSKKS